MTECQKLCEYLVEQLGEKVELKVTVMNGVEKVTGTYKGQGVYFEFGEDSESLFMYSLDDDSTFLRELIPVINVYRDGDEPILKYDTYNLVKDEIIDTTIEWSNNPEVRKLMLETGNVYKYPFGAKNLVTFFEPKEDKDKRLGLTALSPVFFPNSSFHNFDKLTEMVNGYNEQDAFLALSTVNSISRQITNRTWRGYWPDPLVVNDVVDLILSRISMLINSDANNISSFLASELYNSWYDKWNEYFTYDKRCEYMESRINGEDVSSFVPDKGQSLIKKSY